MRRRVLMEGDGVMRDLMAMRLMNTMTEYSSNEVTVVSQYGFSYQSNLESVYLPNCEIIRAGAFYNCEKLSTIYFPVLKDIGQMNVFRGCKSLTEFITGKSFDSRLDVSAFENCSNLVKADFYHINGLGIAAFALSCQNLETLIIRNTDFVPPFNVNGFGGSTTKMNTGEGKIYVPESMVSSYKANSKWSKYADQIYSIEELTE